MRESYPRAGTKSPWQTSWPSLQTDLRNAGATWVDEPNVTDGNITSSRKPDDLPQFNPAMIALFARAERTAAAR
jgi:protease I